MNRYCRINPYNYLVPYNSLAGSIFHQTTKSTDAKHPTYLVSAYRSAATNAGPIGIFVPKAGVGVCSSSGFPGKYGKAMGSEAQATSFFAQAGAGRRWVEE